MAGTFTFVMYTGEDFDFTLTWLNSSGNPVNVSGYTGEFIIGEGMIDIPGAQGSVTMGGDAGTIRLYIPKEVTEPLSPIARPYRLFITDTTTNETSCLLAGMFRTQ